MNEIKFSDVLKEAMTKYHVKNESCSNHQITSVDSIVCAFKKNRSLQHCMIEKIGGNN